MPDEPRLITCIVPAEEPEPERQCYAAAAAQAVGEGLELVGKGVRRRVRHRGRTYIEVTWHTRPAPPVAESGWVRKL